MWTLVRCSEKTKAFCAWLTVFLVYKAVVLLLAIISFLCVTYAWMYAFVFVLSTRKYCESKFPVQRTKKKHHPGVVLLSVCLCERFRIAWESFCGENSRTYIKRERAIRADNMVEISFKLLRLGVCAEIFFFCLTVVYSNEHYWDAVYFFVFFFLLFAIVREKILCNSLQKKYLVISTDIFERT